MGEKAQSKDNSNKNKREREVFIWFKQSLFTFIKIWTIKIIVRPLKQARLIVNAHKHNLLNSFCSNGYVCLY